MLKILVNEHNVIYSNIFFNFLTVLPNTNISNSLNWLKNKKLSRNRPALSSKGLTWIEWNFISKNFLGVCLVCIFIFCFHFWKLFSFSKDLNSDNMLDLTSCLKLFLWGFCFQLKNIFTKNVILLFLFSGSVGKIFSLKMFSKIQSNTFPSLFFVFSENENKKQPKQTPPY